jgi:hypothetical protein
MTIDLVSRDEVIDEDKRNSKKRYLPTDAICVRCGCVNNGYWESECVICSCKCGGHDFIAGKLGIDLRLLLDLKIDEIRMMCESCDVACGNKSRAEMTVLLLREFHWFQDFDRLITKELIRKILKRNKKKFRFTLDIESEVIKVKKEINKEIRWNLVRKEDVLK